MRLCLVSKCSASHSGSFSANPVQIHCVFFSLRTLCIIPYISTAYFSHTFIQANSTALLIIYSRMHSRIYFLASSTHQSFLQHVQGREYTLNKSADMMTPRHAHARCMHAIDDDGPSESPDLFGSCTIAKTVIH